MNSGFITSRNSYFFLELLSQSFAYDALIAQIEVLMDSVVQVISSVGMAAAVSVILRVAGLVI